MQFDYTPAGHTLTEAEITAYEAGANIKLPPQYRQFLLQHNGCYPIGMIRIDTGFDADVSEIYPLFTRKQKHPNITVARPSGDMIWFAGDSGGGEFGLALKSRSFGKVFWFDTPHSEIEAPEPDDCTCVALTFAGFIQSLVPIA